MKQLKESWVGKMYNASSEELNHMGSLIKEGGYSAFSDFLNELKEEIKSFEVQDMDKIQKLLDRAQATLPEPGSISPSWERIWEELDANVKIKAEIMDSVPVDKQNGEWQIIMDNPYTNDNIVCYPGLSFIEAAYLYGYFKPQLKKNEYIRLQKIMELRKETG